MASSVQNNKASPSAFCVCCRVWNMWCWRAFKWVPVLLIVSIVTWSYYAYAIQLCLLTIDNTVQQVLYLLIYHALLIMFCWSYWRTVFAEVKPVPDKYKLPEEEIANLLSAETEEGQRRILEDFAKDLPILTRVKNVIRKYSKRFSPRPTKKSILEKFASKVPALTRTMSGSVRYCNRCVLVKPDRAHHCSLCQRCILKMDHHCPWVNNCVCFFNYKFFMLFLGYALLYCIFLMATCLPYFIKFWKYFPAEPPKGGDFANATGAGRYHIVFAFFVSLMFGISIGSLFGYHVYLVLTNRTTLDMLLSYRGYSSPTGQIISNWFSLMINEAFRAPMFRSGTDRRGFSIGAFNNFKEVFGINPHLWLLPVFTSLGDGCEFPVRREHQLQTFTTQQELSYDSMGTTRSSFGDGIVYPLPIQEEDTESLLSCERWDRWGDRARPFDERESSSFDEL